MQGKIFPQIAIVFSIGCAFFIPGGAVLRAYDEPRFNVPVFNSDGLTLSEGEVEATVGSLVAVASDPTQDSDLKEKAMAIALRLDPMNSAARKANDALLQELDPVPVVGLDAAKVGDDLWKTAHRLLKNKPTPDDAKFAPYLMEIALVFHPAPSADNIWRFGEITEQNELNWVDLVKLQPEESLSNGRINELLASLDKEPVPVVPAVTTPAVTTPMPVVVTPPAMVEVPMTTTVEETPVKEVPISPVKIASGKLAAVLQTPQGPVAATVILEIRDATTDEESLFSVFAPDGSERGTFEMKMRSKSGQSIGLTGLDEAVSQVKKLFPRWPDKKIAEMSAVTAAGGPLRIPGVDEANVKIPAIALLEQAFSGVEVSDDFVFIEPGKSAYRALVEATKFGKSKGIVPSSLYSAILEEVVVEGEGTAIGEMQFIKVSGGAETRSILRGKSDIPIIESLAAFDAIIDKKPAAMSIVEFSRIASVTTALTAFSEKYPFHMSAKIMANLSEQSVSPELMMKRAIASIDAVMKPFAAIYAEKTSPDGGGVEQDLSRDFREAGATFSKLRTEVPATATKYLKRAETVMDRMQVFLEMKNQSSSIGNQRLRELKEAIIELNDEREQLGLGPLGS